MAITFKNEGQKLLKTLIVLFLGLFSSLPGLSYHSTGTIIDSTLIANGLNSGIEDPYMSKEFEVKGPGLLKVFTLGGDIRVIPNNGSQKVRVELYVDRGFTFWLKAGTLDNFRITMMQRNEEIVASVERKKRETGLFSDRMSFSFRVYIPESMSTELKTLGGNISLEKAKGKQSIKTGGGTISLKHISGYVEAYTSGGNIEIIDSDGTLYAQTEGGNIKLIRSKGEIRLKTNGGRIVSERISGTMLAKVGGGDIWADFIEVGRGVYLETSAGNIHLEVPEQEGYNLDVKGTRVQFSDPDRVYGEVSQKLLKGTYRNSGPPIKLNTNAGSVTLKIK